MSLKTASNPYGVRLLGIEPDSIFVTQIAPGDMNVGFRPSREFNQDIGKAKRAAENGPVVITDRGKPAYVLLDIDDYQAMADQTPSIVELLAHRAAAEIEFEPDKLNEPLSSDINLT